ncbi:helix-turn-helix domain-containing protein [Streptomyces sioyaensis]|uniref:helix-turn-helix domain-containing protein n=1 Tax=Streptomyces sioyaensis TaxID=67364 RepID=UPI0033E1CFBC
MARCHPDQTARAAHHQPKATSPTDRPRPNEPRSPADRPHRREPARPPAQIRLPRTAPRTGPRRRSRIRPADRGTPTPDSPPARDDAPAPESLRELTSAAAAVYTELLSPTEPVTVAELAHAAGIGHSTAARVVATLEKRGLATCTPGAHDGPSRVPDLWHSAPALESTTEHNEALSQGVLETAADDSAAPVGRSAEDQGDSAQTNSLGSATAPEPDTVPPTTAGESEVPQRGATHEPTPEPSKALAPNATAPATEPETCTPHADPPQNAKHQDSDDDAEPRGYIKGGNAPAPQPTPTQLSPAREGGLHREHFGRWSPTTSRHTRARHSPPPGSAASSRSPPAPSPTYPYALVKLAATGVAEQVTDHPRTFRLAQPSQTGTTP